MGRHNWRSSLRHDNLPPGPQPAGLLDDDPTLGAELVDRGELYPDLDAPGPQWVGAMA
jgi:hypothetical protein